MNLEEFNSINKVEKILSEDEQLNEGISFFKDSKRLINLCDKLGHEAFKEGGKEGYEEVEDVIRKIRSIASIFGRLEKDFAKAETDEQKEDLKEKYKNIKEEYKELLKLVNKRTFQSFLKTGAKVTLIAAPIVYAFSMVNIFIELVNNVLESTGDYFTGTDLDNISSSTETYFSKLGNALKKAGEAALKITGVGAASAVVKFIVKKLSDVYLEEETRKALENLRKKENAKSEE